MCLYVCAGVFRHLYTLLIAAYGWTDPAAARAQMASQSTRMCAALLPPQQPALADGYFQHDGTVGKFLAWVMGLDHGVPQLPDCFLFRLCPGVKQTHKPQKANPFANHLRRHVANGSPSDVSTKCASFKPTGYACGIDAVFPTTSWPPQRGL